MAVNWVALIVFIVFFAGITILGFFAAHWRRGDLDLLQSRARGLYEATLTAQPPLTITTFHAWFLQLLKRAPLDAGAHYSLARALKQTRRRDEALASAKRAADLDPGNEKYSAFVADLSKPKGKSQGTPAN